MILTFKCYYKIIIKLNPAQKCGVCLLILISMLLKRKRKFLLKVLEKLIKEIHEKIVAARVGKGVPGPDLTTVRRALKGLTFRRGMLALGGGADLRARCGGEPCPYVFFIFFSYFFSALGGAGGLPGPLPDDAGGAGRRPAPLPPQPLALAAPQQPPVRKKKSQKIKKTSKNVRQYGRI